ncbi:hypothetical protein ACJRO7_017913 [Eucalyptus globulus]|uniref:RING-type domain-containing protein n=1 Tax=Eucalyptus globulus TaxID=34317 RepID=A0ABD3KY30_EUCGL
MPSVERIWDLRLTGTPRTSDDHSAVVNLFFRQQLVLQNLGSGITTYGDAAIVARTRMVLPPGFLRLPVETSVHIGYILDQFGVDHRDQSSFAMRIWDAARDLSRLHPRGVRVTAILDLTILEISEVGDWGMHGVMEQPDSEPGRVVRRGASKSAILGLKEKVYAAEGGDCCSICLEDFHRAEKVTELPCSHVFHRRCIIKWLEGSNSCPLCRSQLDT